MTQVAKVDKKGTVTLATVDEKLNDGDPVNNLTSKISVVSEDELAAGDVVYYAVIDGNAYTYLADVVTAKIDKVNRNKLTATTTDGDEYEQSGVHNHTDKDSGIKAGVTGLVGNTSYDLYFDRYGYLAAYTESTSNGEFVLLTDGWFASWKTSNEYAVKAYIDGEIQTVDITKGGSLFVSNAENNEWGQLEEFGDINYTGTATKTIVASLDNGTLTPVDQVYRYRENVVLVDLGTTIPLRTVTEGTIYSTTNNGAYAKVGTEGAADVRALSTTTYYYVYNTTRNTVVREYVGYANIPAIDRTQIEDVYAVGTRAKDAATDTYYTASVVVVELKKGYQEFDAETVFLVDLPEVGSNVKIENAQVIREDGSVDTIAIDLTKSTLRPYDPAGNKDVYEDQHLFAGLYHIWESDVKDVYIVDALDRADIAAENFLVGTVLKNTATGGTDWTSINTYEWDNEAIADVEEIAKKNVESSSYYELSITDPTRSKPYYTVNLSESDRDTALAQNKDTKVKGAADTLNEVLISYNTKGEIIYAISFNEYAKTTPTLVPDQAQTVWENSIPAAEVEVIPGAPVVTFYDEEVTLSDSNYTTTVSYADAEDASVAFNVKNGVVVTISGEVDLSKNEDVTYTGTIYGSDGKGYSFSLTQKAAGDDATLVVAEGSKDDVQIVEDSATAGTIALVGGGKTSVQALIDAVKKNDENATLTWEFVTSGITYTESKVDKGTSTDDFSRITATVTAEDGTTKIVYTLGAIDYTITAGTFTTNGSVDSNWTITAPTDVDSAQPKLTVKVQNSGSLSDRTRTFVVTDEDANELGSATQSGTLNANEEVEITIDNPYKDATINITLTTVDN